MHFWIDKRSQACGFNGRHGVPASLASGWRRNKSMVTPVHRFQSIESANTTQQYRRTYQQSASQTRTSQINQCHSPINGNEPASTGSIISRPALATELEAPVYLDPSAEGTIENAPHAQLMRLGGLTKYGMWASFGLTTVSVAATKFYVDHQGTFEILLLCTLGVLSAGLLISCLLTVCKRNTSQQVVNVQIPHPQSTDVEMEIPEVMPQREILIAPLPASISQQSTIEAGRVAQELEQPPPPYHIAILLSVKDHNCAEFPPPSYESAIR